MEGVRALCQSADLVALQETWLLPHDLPLLSAIDDSFGCTGTSAVDTAAGLLSGRPYGGVALLWRKSAFESVSVIQCDNVRVIHFCSDQSWFCVDMEMCDGNTYTFTSESHGCNRWLDHCIVTESARQSVVSVKVLYDVYWSDHFPIVVECNLYKINPKILDHVHENDFVNRVMWGERTTEQTSKYHDLCHAKLRLIDIPLELSDCCDRFCGCSEHCSVLDDMYLNIVDILTQNAALTYRKKCRRRGGYITGWNKHVADAHREARLQFQIWTVAGRPTRGRIFNEMAEARKHFKAKLKWCQNRQDQLKMDLLASNHNTGNFKHFWKNTNKMNVRPSLPVSVGGNTDHRSIAEAFRDHFSVRSPLTSASHSTVGAETIVTEQNPKIPAKKVATIISKMQRGKSPGHDGLSIEHFKHAGVHLPRVLSLFFTLCLGHSYLPEPLMRTIVVPVVKNKTGDTSDMSNYRPISLATTMAKVLDGVLNGCLSQYIEVHDAQFGFKAGVSTESAIFSLKHTINYYTARRTPVYACFLDLSKAFDLVSYEILWNRLRGAGVPAEYTALLRYWYAHQTNRVRWVGTLSDEYRMECGVRQGGLSSPLLFNLYMNQLIGRLSGTHVGCHIDGICVNNLSYADDMVLLSPSMGGLRELLSICETYAEVHGLKYNSKKSEVLVFKAPRQQPRRVPPVYLNGVELKVVESFKYLGHVVTSDLRDDVDIERERRALAVRSNMLARRFARCTADVKVTLFKAFCQSFYSGGLWVSYTRRAYNALRVQYNDAFRMLLRLPRRCSASGMFAEAGTDGFHAIMRKKATSLLQRLRNTRNGILKVIVGRPDCPIQRRWVEVAIGSYK